MCFEGLPSYRCFLSEMFLGIGLHILKEIQKFFRLEIIYIIILDSKYDYRTEGKCIVF